ncbi:hypothetical protein CAC01_30980 (plasmid) [Streptomyces sp. CLI2509]|nr:hypothetical protein CAC01_30980 [Streptomyces sp. CLI2509]
MASACAACYRPAPSTSRPPPPRPPRPRRSRPTSTCPSRNRAPRGRSSSRTTLASSPRPPGTDPAFRLVLAPHAAGRGRDRPPGPPHPSVEGARHGPHVLHSPPRARPHRGGPRPRALARDR